MVAVVVQSTYYDVVLSLAQYDRAEVSMNSRCSTLFGAQRVYAGSAVYVAARASGVTMMSPPGAMYMYVQPAELGSVSVPWLGVCVIGPRVSPQHPGYSLECVSYKP